EVPQARDGPPPPPPEQPARVVVVAERLIVRVGLGAGPGPAGQLFRPIDRALGRRLLEQPLEDPMGKRAGQRNLARGVGQAVDVAEPPPPGAVAVSTRARRRQVAWDARRGKVGVVDRVDYVLAIVEELHACSSTTGL